MSDKPGPYKIDWTHFERVVMPSLTSRDLVLGIPSAGTTTAHVERLQQLATQLQQHKVPFAVLQIRDSEAAQNPAVINALNILSTEHSVRTVSIVLSSPIAQPTQSMTTVFQTDFATKLVLNAMSTGAHVLKGLVYRNRMINVRASNSKLFARAIGIVAAVAGVQPAEARWAVLRSIYRFDDAKQAPAHVLSDDYPVAMHVQAATARDRMVPVAILLAKCASMLCAEAELALSSNTPIRSVIQQTLRISPVASA